MKLHTDVEKAEVGGSTEEGIFHIKSSAKAFSILSSGLYSDKFKAIVRELSCNALDSHIEAGRADVPFSIHLPNRIEPWLAVKDEGIGLDHEGVMHVYTTYFESTKNETNDLIGGLGLGSKSPFSYTHNFTVTAIKDGVKRVYGCYINDQGIPSIAKMGDGVSTEEHNGVEVKFSVQTEDYEKFDAACREVFMWFDVKPTITGRRVIIPEVEYEDELVKGVRIRADVEPRQYGRDQNRAIAVMGHVAYPINPPADLVSAELAELLKIPFVIDFNIGELDFTPSREHLQYIPATMKAITDKLVEVYSVYQQYARTQIQSAKTPWTKLEQAQKFAQQPIFRSIVKQVLDELSKKTKAYDYVYNDRSSKAGIKRNFAEDFVAQKVGFGWTMYATDRRRRAEYVKLVKSSLVDDFTVGPEQKGRIYIDDLGRGGWGRIRSAVERGNTSGHIMSSDNVPVLVIKTDDPDHIKFVRKYFLGHEVFLASNLDRLTYHRDRSSNGSVRTGTSTEIDYLMIDKVDKGRWETEYVWAPRTGKPADLITAERPTLYYVRVKNRTVIYNGEPLDRETWKDLLTRLEKSSLIPSPKDCVIGVRDKNVELLDENCADLFETIENVLQQLTSRRMKSWTRYEAAMKEAWRTFDQEEMKHLREALPSSHPINRFWYNAERGLKRNGFEGTTLLAVVEVMKWFHGWNHKRITDLEVARDEGTKMWQAIIKKYPMFEWMSGSHRRYRKVERLFARDVAEYILMVDNVHTKEDNKAAQTLEAA